MSDTKKTTPALPVTLILLSGLALSACSGGNEAASAECAAAAGTVAAIAPMIGGEIAAFSVADEPKKLTEMRFSDRDGKPFTMEDFEGKVVLFNLWATWCAPCREEMPYFDNLQTELGGDDFTMLPVSVDRGDTQKPLAFYEEIGLQNLPFYQDNTMGIFQELRRQGHAVGLPVTVLLDDEGCVLGSINGPAKWDSEEAKAMLRRVIEG